MKNIFPKSFTGFDVLGIAMFSFGIFYQSVSYMILIIWLLFFVFIYRLSFSFDEEKINQFINFTNFKDYKVPRKYIKTTYTVAYLFIISYLVLWFKGEFNQYISLLFPISLAFAVGCKKCILAIKLIFEKGLIKAFFLNEKFYSYMVLDADKNEEAEQQQKRPVTEEVFSRILESYAAQLWHGDIRKVLTPASILSLENISSDTDPDMFMLSDFDDFIEEVVFMTFEWTSTIEGLKDFLLDRIINEDESLIDFKWRIGKFGETFIYDGEAYYHEYEDKESFLEDVNYSQVIKILEKCWDRACKTEEVFPEDEAMNDRRNGFIAWE